VHKEPKGDKVSKVLVDQELQVLKELKEPPLHPTVLKEHKGLREQEDHKGLKVQ
jgi:hypothetical protein